MTQCQENNHYLILQNHSNLKKDYLGMEKIMKTQKKIYKKINYLFNLN